MRHSIADLKSFVKADLAFHHELATAADNRLLLDLLQVVRSLLRVWVDRAVQDEGHARTALEEHEAVYQALAARDGDAAASAMAAHMTTASARLAAAGVGESARAVPGAATGAA
jgi:GntR family transcriptional repressor for pyruvate dehydrogenase complex